MSRKLVAKRGFVEHLLDLFEIQKPFVAMQASALGIQKSCVALPASALVMRPPPLIVLESVPSSRFCLVASYIASSADAGTEKLLGLSHFSVHEAFPSLRSPDR